MPNTKILKYIAAAVLAAAAAGCTDDPAEPGAGSGAVGERLPASLSLTIGTPEMFDISVDAGTRNTRASGPVTTGPMFPDSEDSGWSDAELLAGGRTIRRLTVFLVDVVTNRMVAYRHIVNPDASGDNKVVHKPVPDKDNGFVKDGKVDPSLYSSNTIKLTFDYDKPLHGDVERLTHGRYALLAMANYMSLPVKDAGANDAADHPSVQGCNEFVKEIHYLIHQFYGDNANDQQLTDETFLRTMGKGIDNFNKDLNETVRNFMDYVVDVRKGVDDANQPYQPFVRAKVDETPLFTMTYIDLNPGNNVIKEPITLYRTMSRVRVCVKNFSEEPLSVTSLSFSENFSKDRTYFCRLPGAADIFEGLGEIHGAPDVGYSESIIAFPYWKTSQSADKAALIEGQDNYFIIDDDDTERGEIGYGRPVIQKGQTAAVFDGFICPTRAEDLKKVDGSSKYHNYTYTIGVEYKNVTDYIEKLEVTTNKLNCDVTNSYVNNNINGKYFILQNVATGSMLYERDNASIASQNISIGTLKTLLENRHEQDYLRYVWLLTKDANGIVLKNAKLGDVLFMTTDGNDTAVTGSSVTPVSFTLGRARNNTWSEYNYNFYLEKGGWSSTKYYLYSDNSGNISRSTTDSENSRWKLYPVTYETGSPKTEKEVVLQTIDSQTAEVSDVMEICRNDFIRILVEVSYNKEKGDFEFHVEPWEKGKGGDITFN